MLSVALAGKPNAGKSTFYKAVRMVDDEKRRENGHETGFAE
jgi:ribosome-binding ATPase YchF (GTP1/OBG family)